jgi:hypothetical protein
MSADPREPDRPDRERDERRDDPPPRREKRPKHPPLTQREVFDLLLRDPAVRPYLYAALGALALVFLVLFDNGSDIGAVLIALLGTANLLFRWVSGPPFLLFVISWFALFPFGIPEAEFADPRRIGDNYFRIADLVLVLAALVYVRCAFRIFGLIHAAMPLENAFKRPEDAPPRRPAAHVSPNELVWLIGTAVALALLGQGAWWLVNNVEFFPADGDFPFRWADPDDARRFLRRGPLDHGEFTAGQTRFFVTTFVLFAGYLALRLVFGYWRLRAMSAAEAASVCTDTAWAETHRERVRLEKWRLWRIQQALERERAAKRAEREAKKREEARAREEERRKARAAYEAERQRERAERRRRRDEDEEDEDDDRPRRRRPRADDDDDDRPRRRR